MKDAIEVEIHAPECRTAFDYALWFDMHPQPAWIFDRRTFQFLAVNQAAAAQYGCTREELLSMSVLELHPEEERADVMAEHAVYPLGDALTTAGYWRHQRRDGTRIDVEVFHARTTFEGVDAEAVVASDVTARRRAERHLAIQHEIASVFAECRSIDDAAGRILSAICRSLGWQYGGLWQLDRVKEVMRHIASWRRETDAMNAFECLSRRTALPRGVGIAGQVWRDCAPLWIPDIALDNDLPRRTAAIQAGLHSAFAVPIMIQGEVLGAMEFASRSIQAPDPSLLQTMLTLGVQVGHYLERVLAESARDEQRTLAQLNAGVANAMASGESLECSLTQSVDSLVHHLDASFAGVWILPKHSTTLDLRASSGHHPHLAGMHTQVPVGVSSIGLIAQERKSKLINCVGVEAEGVEGGMAFAGYPLLVDGETVGVMAIFSSQRLRQAALDALDLVAQEVALGIERKRAEQALRDSEERYRRIIETTAEGIWITDTQWRTTFVNRHMEAMIGGGMVGRDARDFIFPKDLADVTARFESLSAGNNEIFDCQIRRADGTGLWTSISATAILDDHGKFAGALGMLTGVTERKLAEDALRASEEFNKRIVESTGDGILVVDSQGRFSYLSEAARRLLEMEEGADPAGRSWLDFWDPGSRRGLEDALAQAEASGRGSFEGTCTTVRGIPRRLEVGLSAIRGQAGSVERVAAVVRDVTERMHLQMQLAQAQKLESIGQLAAGVAHEINTPIQYVGDNARFLQDAFEELKPILTPDVPQSGAPPDVPYLCEEIPKALQQLLEGVEHVGRIVRAMKEFSHPGPIEKTAVDLNRAIQSTVVVSRNEWKYVAEVVEDLDPSLPPVQCVAGEVNQAMLNLVVNAAHAIAEKAEHDKSEKGSGKKGVITVSTRHDANWAEIRVRDTGTGIPEPIRGKVFDPFFTTKEVGKGTGQGLSIAHAAIVKNHHGTLQFETETGVGTTFIVRLPIAGA